MNDVLISIKALSKNYPGVRALREVDLDIRRGEVHAIVGENGAGKSTLIKILVGAEKRSSGTISIGGRELEFDSPVQAYQAGISVIYQEMSLVPHLTVQQNVFLGVETAETPLGVLNEARMAEQMREVSERSNFAIDPGKKVRNLGIAAQRIVEIMKSLARRSSILVMDEPTDALSRSDSECLFEVIRKLRDEGITVLYVTHSLEEVAEIADRVSILRDGSRVATLETSSCSRDDIVNAMLGDKLRDIKLGTVETGDDNGRKILEFSNSVPAFQVTNYSSPGHFKDINLAVYPGRITALTGLVGAGKTELFKAIIGMDRSCRGSVSIHGRDVSIRSPGQAVRHGIYLIPEDRKAEGLVMEFELYKNITISSLRNFTRFGTLSLKREKSRARSLIEDLDIRARNVGQKVRHLSGGNQQKVVIAKALAASPEILLMDEPTRGIDVGAKAEVFRLMRELADRGVCIVFATSEPEEVFRVADRIVVINKGVIVSEADHGVDFETVMNHVLSEVKHDAG